MNLQGKVDITVVSNVSISIALVNVNTNVTPLFENNDTATWPPASNAACACQMLLPSSLIVAYN